MMLKKVISCFNQKMTVHALGKIALIFFILFLVMQTSALWGKGFQLLSSILKPFIIGFILAFIVHPVIEYFEKMRVPKAITITALWIVIVLVISLLLLFLLPSLYSKIIDLSTSMLSGIQGISDYIVDIAAFKDFSLINSITDYINSIITDLKNLLPEIISILPNVMSKALGVVTNITFSIIIAIYMSMDYQRICEFIKKACCLVHPSADVYIHEISLDVGVYIRSLFILMIIKFVEYSALYFLIGHGDWMIIGVLMAIGIFIPYIGGTIGNAIGIITGLTLAPIQMVILLIGIAVLSNIDAYVIAPRVHKKRSDLGVIVSLLAVFAGGVLYSGIGIMISIPLTISIKSAYETYLQRHDKAVS